MSGHWLALASQLADIKGRSSAIAQRLARRVALAAAVGVLLAIAFGLALAALSVWLAGQFGVVAGLAIVAFLLAATALAIHFGAHYTTVKRKNTAPGASLSDAPVVEEPAVSLSDEAAIAAMAVLGFIGYLLGKNVPRAKAAPPETDDA